MKLEWLEDMIALYSTRTLTAAAEKRGVSQPAFSRRIQSLEQWLGVSLLDRDKKPACITSAARQNEALLRSLVATIHEFRATSRLQSKGQNHLTIGAQHSLNPRSLLELLERHKPSSDATYRLVAGDRQECIAKLLAGEIDILFCYTAPTELNVVPPSVGKVIVVGHDKLVPVCAPSARRVGRKSRETTPILAYPPESFFGNLLWGGVFSQVLANQSLQVTCVSSFSQALFDLALAGYGVAWLPERFASAALRDGRLVTFDFAGGIVELNILVIVARRHFEKLQPFIRGLMNSRNL